MDKNKFEIGELIFTLDSGIVGTIKGRSIRNNDVMDNLYYVVFLDGSNQIYREDMLVSLVDNREEHFKELLGE